MMRNTRSTKGLPCTISSVKLNNKNNSNSVWPRSKQRRWSRSNKTNDIDTIEKDQQFID
jgi:hypothetical protein